MFWRLWGPVSDNFQVAIVISSPYVKIQNFPKMRFFRYFWIFWCWSFWLQKSIKIVKNMKKFKNMFFTSQRYFQIPRMLFYDHYIQFYVNLKINRKLYFLPFEVFWLFLAEIGIFCLFSNSRRIEYNDNKIAFWVSGNIFAM